jgi:membrane-associated HD superfamily phosphohydrolase
MSGVGDMTSINREFIGIKGFEVSNRKLANLSSNMGDFNSGYVSRNLQSHLFQGPITSASYNPLNLKFDRQERSTKAKPQDNDVLN